MAPTAAAVSFSAARPSSAAAVRARAASVSAGVGRVRAGQQPEGGKWWAPLVGWSGKADYIEPATAMVVQEEEKASARSFVGGLTEEKARQLRARMSETESFHDAMYHSAIASRLARSS